MAFTLIMDRFAAPYEVDRALTFDAGTRTILINVLTPNTAAPVRYFSFRPFLWFNPGVGGLGFTDFYFRHETIWRNRQAFRYTFPERWGLETMRLNGGDPALLRFQVWYE